MNKNRVFFSALAMIAIIVLSLIAVSPAQAASLTITGSASPDMIKSGSVTSISYTLSELIGGDVAVIVNGSGGNTVWTSHLPGQASGTHTTTWGGTYANGTPVPDDYYTITLTVNTGTLGSLGTGNDQFWGPFGLDVDDYGNLYVTDMPNQRVQVFDRSGTYLRTLGITRVEGTDNAHFTYPYGVAVDTSGNTYVAEMGNKRVQVFDSTGAYLRTIGPGIDGTSSFYAPCDVAVDSSGNTYVADWGWNSRIYIFDSTGDWLRTIGTWHGDGIYEFNLVSGVGVDESGNIYVADNGNHRVQVFDSTGTYLRTLGITGVSGSDNAHFDTPNDVAVDKSGNTYVADCANNRIQIFDSTGAYLRTIGTTGIRGTEGDLLYNPVSVDVDDDGNVYVSDTGNDRVRVFYSSSYTATSAVYVENTAPTVTCTLAGTPVNGWYTTDVPVTLEAADNPGGSGLETLKYSMDNVNWITYSGTFTVSGEGMNTVYWNCTDHVGNSAIGNQSVNIDTVAPITTAMLSGTLLDGVYTSSVTVTLAVDDTASGVNYSEYRVNNENWTSYTVPFTLSGSSTVSYRSADLVGNLETMNNLSFTRIYLPPATISMDEMYGEQHMTPAPLATPVQTAIPMPAGIATSSATPAPPTSVTPLPVASPLATPAESSQSSGYQLWLAFGLIGIIIVSVSGYLLFFRK